MELANNRFPTSKGSRMLTSEGSIDLNEIKFKLQVIQMTYFPFIKKIKNIKISQ